MTDDTSTPGSGFDSASWPCGTRNLSDY
ncbi:MAG: hypothetical protein ACI9HH_005726, partial [Pseudomonadota bacterium]